MNVISKLCISNKYLIDETKDVLLTIVTWRIPGKLFIWFVQCIFHTITYMQFEARTPVFIVNLLHLHILKHHIKMLQIILLNFFPSSVFCYGWYIYTDSYITTPCFIIYLCSKLCCSFESMLSHNSNSKI